MNNRRLRIALISEHASPAAPSSSGRADEEDIHVAQVARCLAAAGHHVDVLTRRDAPTQPAVAVLPRGVRVLHLDAGPPCFVPKAALLPHMAAFSDAAHRVFELDAPYDVVHANFFMSGWVGLSLRERFDVPLVTTFHAMSLAQREHQREHQRDSTDEADAARLDIERTVARQSDCVIAGCPQDEDAMQRLYGVEPARISVVPCGVDTLALRPGDRREARDRLKLARDEFIVLQHGGLLPHQGIDNVLHALALLDKAPAPPGSQRPRLVVVTEGADAPGESVAPAVVRLRQLAAELGVAERVQFMGRRECAHLRDLYVAADVFVTTPWYEPFGLTPLEAMACGTPVVGSTVGGVGYTVVDGVTGFLVPPHDSVALATRLAALRAAPALGANMGRAGVRRMRTHFTWEQAALRLARVYAMASARSFATPSAATTRRHHALPSGRAPGPVSAAQLARR